MLINSLQSYAVTPTSTGIETVMGSSTVCFSLAIFCITSGLPNTACIPSRSKTSATKTTELGSLVSWNVSNPDANFENNSTRSWCPLSHVSIFPTLWRTTTVWHFLKFNFNAYSKQFSASLAGLTYFQSLSALTTRSGKSRLPFWFVLILVSSFNKN